jgi:hypothetical protein
LYPIIIIRVNPNPNPNPFIPYLYPIHTHCIYTPFVPTIEFDK